MRTSLLLGVGLGLVLGALISVALYIPIELADTPASAADKARMEIISECAIDGATQHRGRSYLCVMLPTDRAPVMPDIQQPTVKPGKTS